MADIDSARQQMMEELERKIRSDGRLGSIRNKIQNGDYSEAGQYGTRCGELLSEVIRQNMTEDLFQECDVNGLASMLLPVIEKETEYVSNAVAAVQRSQNQETGIGIKPIKTDFDASQYYNIFGKMQAYDSYDEAAWLLDEPITLDSLQVVDKTMKENAEFHYKSGLRTKVVRTIESDNPCEECEAAAGEYYFPDVPDYVWYRHNGCRCEIIIETEKDESQYNDRTEQRFNTDDARTRINSSKTLLIENNAVYHNNKAIILRDQYINPEFRGKVLEVHRVFAEKGWQTTEHFCKNILGRIDQGRIPDLQSVYSVLKEKSNYIDLETHRYVRWYNGIAVIIDDINGSLVTVLDRKTKKDMWVEIYD